MKEIGSFMEKQTKFWNEFQALGSDNQLKLDEKFENESKLNNTVSEARLNALTFIGVEDEVK